MRGSNIVGLQKQMDLINPAPVVYSTQKLARPADGSELDNDVVDDFDTLEIFELIRGINDPEHPLSLEQLKVVQLDLTKIDNKHSRVDVQFVPTIPHCSMSTLIGLCIRVKLARSLPERFKLSVRVNPGSHQSEADVNKQLNDKERVAAALENPSLLEVVNRCLLPSLLES